MLELVSFATQDIPPRTFRGYENSFILRVKASDGNEYTSFESIEYKDDKEAIEAMAKQKIQALNNSISH